MVSTDQIIQNIIDNALHNINNNIELFEDASEAGVFAEGYLDKFRSVCSQCVNQAEDKEELEEELEEQLLMSFYLQKVFAFYLDEVRRNMDAKDIPIDEPQKTITNVKPIYTIKATGSNDSAKNGNKGAS